MLRNTQSGNCGQDGTVQTDTPERGHNWRWYYKRAADDAVTGAKGVQVRASSASRDHDKGDYGTANETAMALVMHMKTIGKTVVGLVECYSKIMNAQEIEIQRMLLGG